jgi:hypothetical protein
MGKIFIGIDPGVRGACAVLHPLHGPQVCDFEPGVVPRPLLEAAEDSGHFLGHEAVAVIERVSAMPKQGVSSTFKFGTNFGVWIGRLEALGIPYVFVAPGKWQKHAFNDQPRQMHTRNGRKVLNTKAMSLAVARRLYPMLSERLRLKKHDGRADALLIARYAQDLDL